MSGNGRRQFGAPAWREYLRVIGMGGRLEAANARLLLSVGGATPGATGKAIRRLLELGRINSDGYETRTDALDMLRDMWGRGIQTHETPTPRSDWEDLGDGGHVRRVHHGVGHGSGR